MRGFVPLARLNAQERLFLQLQPAGVRWYSMVAGLCDVPDEAHRPSVQDLVDVARSRLHLAPRRLRQRLARMPFDLSAPVWVDEADFDLAAHVSGAELSPGATLDQFRAYAAALAGQGMDMERPLWDVHLAPELEDGRAGFVLRAHHCMLDGNSLTACMAMFTDLEAHPGPRDPPQAWDPEPAPSRVHLVGQSLRDAGGRAAGAVAGARRPRVHPASWATSARELSRAMSEQLRDGASRTAFNAQPTAARAISFHGCELEVVKTVAHAHGATVNDAAVAVVADALRRFYGHSHRPPRRLKLLSPVNLDVPGWEGEHVGFMLVELPVDEPDPGARLDRVAEQSGRQKEDHSPERVDEFLARLARHSDALYRVSQHVVQSPRSANLTLSNLRGPSFPVYLGGARVTGLYPILPLGPHHDLAVGVMSLEGSFFFSAITDPRASPELEGFGECLEAAVAALETDYETDDEQAMEG